MADSLAVCSIKADQRIRGVRGLVRLLRLPKVGRMRSQIPQISVGASTQRPYQFDDI
ncbi:MAG: hypothetical protein AAF329_08065 [Cyanobacteria bacterium P01_A01_bin.17]